MSSFLSVLLLVSSPGISLSLISSSPPLQLRRLDSNAWNSHDVALERLIISDQNFGAATIFGKRLSISRRNRRRDMTILNNEISDTEGSNGGIDEYEIEYEQHVTQQCDSDDKQNKSKKKKTRFIEISSSIELPFSAEVAYDAYSNLPRQSSWSSWLESVEVLDIDGSNSNSNSNSVQSCWTSKIMGIKYSWIAISIENERPHTIQWSSVTGLKNEGTVRFYKKKGNTYQQGPTLMTVEMSFVTPRAVSLIINRSRTLSSYVEKKMIDQSLYDFRDIVLKNDVKKIKEKSSII